MLVSVGDDFEDTVLVPQRTSLPDSSRDLDDTVLTSGATRPPRVSHTAPPPAGPVVVPGTRARFGVRIGLAGDVIPLDVPCYIGRKPRAPRIVPGIAPRLVTVDSPRKEVSGTHVEAREVGSAVVVTDLKSTNGTIVLVPGSQPRTLRQGESLVVSPGTLIDLGDDIVVQVLALRASGTAEAGASE